MIRFCAIAVLLLSAVSFIPVSYCQDDNPPIYDQGDGSPVVKTIDGKVVSVSPQDSKISVRSVRDITFSVPSEAKLVNEDGFDIQLSDIEADNYVVVEYYDDKSGKHMARVISVEYPR